VPASLRAEPLTDLAGGREGDPQLRPALGDLGDGLDRGQVAADHQHRAVRAEAVQPLAQAQRRLPPRHVEGVLGHAGHAVVGDGTAERVEEGVVLEPVGAVAVADRDGPAPRVDGGDPCHPQPDARAGEHRRQVVASQVPAGGELVQAHPLDEVGFCVDHGDLDVVGVQVAGEVARGGGAGVPGPEDDDAMPHVVLLSVSFAV
jgi:hypothetical protein